VYVLYHNPLLDRVLSESVAVKGICGTHQYVVYTSRVDPD